MAKMARALGSGSGRQVELEVISYVKGERERVLGGTLQLAE